MTIECVFRKENRCQSSRDITKCERCKNNTKRNYIEDHFVEAKDNHIPNKNPIVTYQGPAEQTRGYQCPVCGGFTNPYAMRDSLCGCCGFKLNTSCY